MFRPIIAFLNFMQKSPLSESNICQGTALNPETMTTNELLYESGDNIVMIPVDDTVNSKTLKDLSHENRLTVLNADKDDFEMQIKANKLLKNPNHSLLEMQLQSKKNCQCDYDIAEYVDSSKATTDPTEEYLHIYDNIVSENQNEYDGTENKRREERLDNDAKQPGLDKVDDIFPDNEVIVIPEIDLNSSITSDTSNEDPLAIDESFTSSPVKNEFSVLPSNNEWSTLPSSAIVDSITINSQKLDLIAKSSLNIGFDRHCVEEIRSDGSDSGLGTELLTLQSGLCRTETSAIQEISTSDTSNINSTIRTPFVRLGDNILLKQPPRSNLKRRLNINTEHIPMDVTVKLVEQQKKTKRSITFDSVQIYYFTRQQGFSCVPSTGGCTLGMGIQHILIKKLTIAEHLSEIRRAHRLQLQESPRLLSSDDSEESEEDLSEGNGSDFDSECLGFLQPIPPKQRRTLLKAAGVRKIDTIEKLQCRDIRNSRELCGCLCRDYCDPDTCSCSRDGIKCQVDRASFPCGCSRDTCGNIMGRIEFNPARVRTHFIHTIMRLEMESRQHDSNNTAARANVNAPTLTITPQFQSYMYTPKIYLENASTSAICDRNYSTSLENIGQNVPTNEVNHNDDSYNAMPNHLTVAVKPYADTANTAINIINLPFVPAYHSNTFNTNDCQVENSNHEPINKKEEYEQSSTQYSDRLEDALPNEIMKEDSHSCVYKALGNEDTTASVITLTDSTINVLSSHLVENGQLLPLNNDISLPMGSNQSSYNNPNCTCEPNEIHNLHTKHDQTDILSISHVPSDLVNPIDKPAAHV